MKRTFFGILLTGAILLLSACPDTKLPTPSPKVPEPKALDITRFTAHTIYLQATSVGDSAGATAHRA